MIASRNIAVLIGLLILPFAQGMADDIPPCSAPHGVQTRSFPDQIPQILRNALADRYGSFALPQEDFNGTDVRLENRSDRRIIFVWMRGGRWVFATERGGRAYNNPLIVYDLDASGTKATLLKEQIA